MQDFTKQSLNDFSNRYARDDSEHGSKRQRNDGGIDDRQSREIGLMRQNDGVHAPSFVGSASGIYFIRSVHKALSKSREQAPTRTPNQNIVPGEEDQLDEALPYSSKNLWSQYEVKTDWYETTSFDFEMVQVWSRSYFEKWHTAYPFLLAPQVMEYVERNVSPETISILEKENSPSFTIVRAIISISLADLRQSKKTLVQPIPAALVFKSFSEAMTSIQETLLKPTSIEALQAVVAVQLFLVSMLRLNGASRLGGLIVRMAFQMGLHRCPTRYPNFNPEQVQLRRRLFWTIYCIDRHLCQSLGLPLTIRDDDVDVCFFDEEKHSTSHSKKPAMDDRLWMLNFLAKHASIKGQIMELRNKSIHLRQANRDLATLIGARIDKWTNDFQSSVEDDITPAVLRLDSLQQVILRIQRYEAIISLHRPLLALEKTSSDYMASLQACIRAARSIISTLHNYLQTLSHRSNFNVAPLIWPSFTWSVWMSAFIVLHAAIEIEIPKPVARRLADQSIEILKHLSLRGSVWPNVCAVAIDDLFFKLLLDSAAASPQPEPGNTGDAQHRTTEMLSANATNSHDNTPRFEQKQPIHDPQNSHLQNLNFQSEFDQANILLDHANNVSRPNFTDTDLQDSIPWLSGPDASAATSANIFEQFDIPFWMGDDEYSSIMGFNL